MTTQRGQGVAVAEATEQGSDLARWIARARAQAAEAAPRAGRPPRLLVVTGGKGGVGKSNFSLNFSLALRERGRRVLLVDCDSGLGNQDVLLGLCPQRHLGHVLAGTCRVQDAILPVAGGISLLPAASGLVAMGRASSAEVGRLIGALAVLEEGSDLCILDGGAGLGSQVRALLRAAGETLVVTTPEPTALADAYATVKTIHRANPGAVVHLVINMAEGPRDAEAAVRSVLAVCERYLGWVPSYLGAIPRDPAVPRAVREQRPFLLGAPSGPAARALRAMAAAFCSDGPQPGARPAGLRDVLLALLRPTRGPEGGGGEGIAGARGATAVAKGGPMR